MSSSHDPDHSGNAEGITRREFLKGTGAAIAGSTVLAAPLRAAALPQEAAHDARRAEGGKLPASLRVNGVEHRLDVEPQATLAEVLRDTLGLTGTKIGCDGGACGACTVWLDGDPIASCMMLATDAAGHEVVTIEGLARGEELHPVQSAFIAHDAVQCGFCTPGLVMSCAALVERNREPTADDVKAAICGHVCRCGSVPHAIDATLAAAKAMGKG
ncbi:MAG TPA: (2Fe-2S)-binding protein [Usitatibacter sp.]|nr:(2Fe-2S)-binding protein [Usitatibacter sp.]